MRKSPRALIWAIAVTCALPRSVLVAQSSTVDACSVLTREEITTLVGQDPGPPSPGGNRRPDVTNCYWQATSPAGSVVLYAAVDPREPKGLGLQQILKHGKKAHAVSGLGDDAFFVEEPGGIPSGNLYVRVGHYRISIWRQAPPTGTAESVLPTLITLAKAAIPKLR
jgi:hypothetical protein